MKELTHVDERGNPRMVDVADKEVTRRRAVAEGFIRMSDAALKRVTERVGHKGDALTVGQIAGIQGAKRTSDLIPLCHPLPLSSVDVHLTPDPQASGVHCEASIRADWRTGVEMEALTAVSTALLTVYDMLKAVDRGMVIEGVRLVSKEGGRSGTYMAPEKPGARSR